MSDPKYTNPPQVGAGPYDMPQRGVRSPLMLLAIILWLIVILAIVTAQFIVH